MGLYIAVAWTIVFTLRIGPVVGTIDATAGRGVHSGDMLAIPLVLMGLFLFGEGTVFLQRCGGNRQLRHRAADRAAAPVIRITAVSSALLAMPRSAA